MWLSAEAMEGARFGVAAAGSTGARRLVRVNPALWAGHQDEQAVRTVALEVFLNRPETFEAHDDRFQASARAWLRDADLRPYRALLTP